MITKDFVPTSGISSFVIMKSYSCAYYQSYLLILMLSVC